MGDVFDPDAYLKNSPRFAVGNQDLSGATFSVPAPKSDFGFSILDFGRGGGLPGEEGTKGTLGTEGTAGPRELLGKLPAGTRVASGEREGVFDEAPSGALWSLMNSTGRVPRGLAGADKVPELVRFWAGEAEAPENDPDPELSREMRLWFLRNKGRVDLENDPLPRERPQLVAGREPSFGQRMRDWASPVLGETARTRGERVAGEDFLRGLSPLLGEAVAEQGERVRNAPGREAAQWAARELPAGAMEFGLPMVAGVVAAPLSPFGQGAAVTGAGTVGRGGADAWRAWVNNVPYRPNLPENLAYGATWGLFHGAAAGGMQRTGDAALRQFVWRAGLAPAERAQLGVLDLAREGWRAEHPVRAALGAASPAEKLVGKEAARLAWGNQPGVLGSAVRDGVFGAGVDALYQWGARGDVREVDPAQVAGMGGFVGGVSGLLRGVAAAEGARESRRGFIDWAKRVDGDFRGESWGEFKDWLGSRLAKEAGTPRKMGDLRLEMGDVAAAPPAGQMPSGGGGDGSLSLPVGNPPTGGGGRFPIDVVDAAGRKIEGKPVDVAAGVQGTQGAADVLGGELPAVRPVAEILLEGQTAGEVLADYPVVEFPVEGIVVNKDVPQFKGDADAVSGVVEGEQLAGRYERLGTPPIVVWEKLNGEVEVVTGRHRLDLARRSGEQTIPAQVVRERDGFTKEHATLFDTESNIRDEKGTVRDYAKYFRGKPEISRAEAEGRGLLARGKGRAGWHLGHDAEGGLYSLYSNGRIGEEKAVAIARGAPGNEAAQNSAIRIARGKSAAELELYARNLSGLSGQAAAGGAEQLGFAGIDRTFADFEREAEAISKVQAERIAEVRQQILAGQGAARNPDAARKVGLPVDDPAALQTRVEELRRQAAALESPDEGLFNELRRAAGLPVAEKAPVDGLEGAVLPDETAGLALFEERAPVSIAGELRKVMDGAELAKAEYEAVVAAHTNADGSRKAGWMRAPNGEATKLEERQWVQVRTPSFKKWFGDWEVDPANASRVVDENGEPMVVWHGTGNRFESFDPGRIGERGNILGKGYYFASGKDSAAFYANGFSGSGNPVMGVFLNIRNIDAKPKGVMGEGYDGAARGEVYFIPAGRESAIKSATGNSGAFDGGAASILMEDSRQIIIDDFLRFSAPEAKVSFDFDKLPQGDEAAPRNELRRINAYLDRAGIGDPVARRSGYDFLRDSLERVEQAKLERLQALDRSVSEQLELFGQGNVFGGGVLPASGGGGAGAVDPKDVGGKTGSGTGVDDTLSAGAPSGRAVDADVPASAEVYPAGSGSASFQLKAISFTNTFTEKGYLQMIGNPALTAAEMALASQILRNPAFETFYVWPVKGGKLCAPMAVSSRVPNMVNLYDGGEERFFGKIAELLNGVGAEHYWMQHNHPSGSVRHSPEDAFVTEKLFKGVGKVSRAKFLGHLVINHGTYNHLVIEDGKVKGHLGVVAEVAGKPDPILGKSRGESPLLNKFKPMFSDGELIEAAYGLQASESHVTIALAGARGNVNAVLQAPVGSLSDVGFEKELIEAARAAGATNAHMFYSGSDKKVWAGVESFPLATTMHWMRGTEILDRGFGTRELFPEKAARTFRVAEERVPEDAGAFDPERPLIFDDGSGNLSQVALGGMEFVRAVKMPELVRLVRRLSGKLPKLVKHRGGVQGSFSPGSGRITLDRRIFGSPGQAERTLAHELGHLVDYLPEGVMGRGNLLGRLASLRGYLQKTLPESPSGGGGGLSGADRARLRRAAAKAIGERPSGDDAAALQGWRQQVAVDYQRRVGELLKMRGLVAEAEVREELWELSQWWRPLGENPSASFLEYRKSSVELYADALSVLLNAPGEALERAPVFWKTFMEYFDRKPEVKTAFFEMWDFLGRGVLPTLADRHQRLKAAFVRADEALLAREAEREAATRSLSGVLSAAKQQHYDMFSPLVERARALKAAGKELPWDKDPEFVFDAHPLAENANYAWLDRVNTEVVRPLEEAGITRDDFGAWLFYNRVVNESYSVDGTPRGRVALANPHGHTAETARLGMLNMRLQLGLEGTAKLEAIARKFQDMVFEVVEAGGKAGVYSQEVVDRARENKYNYAAFAVVDFLEQSGYVPAGIKQQRGTLSEVANPWMATTMKMMTANSLIAHNTAKRVAVDLLLEHFKDEVKVRGSEAEGKKLEHAPVGMRELMVLRNGEPVEYFVPTEVAESFDKLHPVSQEVVTRVLNYAFRHIAYPLYITFNASFLLWRGPMKDFGRSYANLPPGVSRAKFLGQQLRAWTMSRERLGGEVRGEPMKRRRVLRALGEQRALTGAEQRELRRLDDLALTLEVLETRVLGSPFDSFVNPKGGRLSGEPGYWNRMLQDFNLLPPEKQNWFARQKIFKPAVGLLKAIEKAGMTIEAMPKLSGYKVLTKDLGWAPEEAARYVRNYIGTPNWLKRGKWTLFDGTLLPFFNVATKGYVSELELASGKGQKHGETSAKEQAFSWWMRTAQISLLPRLLRRAALLGLLGVDLQDSYKGIPSYDNISYITIPVGKTDTGVYGGKTVYLKIPENETQQLLGGVLEHLLDLAFNNDPAAKGSVGDLMYFSSGRLPGVNPAISISNGWMQYASGLNPVDNFRMNRVIENDAFLAGGWPAMKDMLAWTWNEVGLANFVRYDSRADSTTEAVVGSMPLLNSMLKISDAGHRERSREIQRKEEVEMAKIRLALPPSVNQVKKELGELTLIRPENLKPEQMHRLRMLGVWQRKVWTPYYEVLKHTSNTDERIRLGKELGEITKGMLGVY